MRASAEIKEKFPIPLNHKKDRSSEKYCSECGFVIRGENHFAGIHHRQKHPTFRG